jgi:hypothetical protein
MKRLTALLFLLSFPMALLAEDVLIAPGMKSVDITLNGESFTIMRNQEAGNTINKLYETTNRGKPQPIMLAAGVETLGELEFIDPGDRYAHGGLVCGPAYSRRGQYT